MTTPEVPVEAVSDWRKYEVGKGDRAGRKITKIYALDARYVIYFVGCELFYEPTTGLATDLGKADAALARISRLLDLRQEDEGRREYNFDLSTLELAADALEMFFCDEKTEALEILDGVRDKLLEKEVVQRRLAYQMGAVLITALAWILYLLYGKHHLWNPWMLSAALAMAGGLFSVCLNIASLEVNVNQGHPFVFAAGATRSVVAFLAGIGLLLAMRSQTFAGIIYKGEVPGHDGLLQITEMFFCFLAGFSEAFVPNILSKAPADKAAADGKPADGKPADGKPADGKPADGKAAAEAKAAADKSAADKAAADKSAVDKAAADKVAADKAAADNAAAAKAAGQ